MYICIIVICLYRSAKDEPAHCPGLHGRQSWPPICGHVYNKWEGMWNSNRDLRQNELHPRGAWYPLGELRGSQWKMQLLTLDHAIQSPLGCSRKHPNTYIHGCPCHVAHTTAKAAGGGFLKVS